MYFETIAQSLKKLSPS